MEMWRGDPEARVTWEPAWPPYAHFVREKRVELGEPKRTLEHFRWLALYHVEGLTYDELARHEQDKQGHPDPSTISRALTQTAALIGITLRPAPRRP